jgi:hypothetical protein
MIFAEGGVTVTSNVTGPARFVEGDGASFGASVCGSGFAVETESGPFALCSADFSAMRPPTMTKRNTKKAVTLLLR